MKPLCSLFLLVCLYQSLNAQDKKWSVEASYPVSVGTDFATDGRGKLDLGVRYRFAEFGDFTLGGSLNASLFSSNSQYDVGTAQGTFFNDFSERNIFLQPRLFLETQFPGVPALRPSIGLGYSWDLYSVDGTFMSEPIDGSDTQGGFNVNAGLSLDVYRNWFLQAQYDYISTPGRSFSGNVSLLKFGVGFRF